MLDSNTYIKSDLNHSLTYIPMSYTLLSAYTDTHFDTPEPPPSSQLLPAREGGGEMNVVPIEAMA